MGASCEKVLAARRRRSARQPQHRFDIVETKDPNGIAATAKTSCSRSSRPHHADLIAPALRPHGEWVGTRLNVFVQAYNTQAVRKQDLRETTWEDCSISKWKGKLGIEAGGLGLASRAVRRSRRGRGHETFQGDRRKKRHVGAQGTYTPDAARGLG